MRVAAASVVFGCLLGCAQLACGQAYPSKTLRVVVAFPAGGPIDIVARLLAPRLAEAMGQQVIVDNRAGANGMIGTEHVARSAPDGYTLLLGSTSALVISPHLYRHMAYDPLSDLVAVAQVSVTPDLLVVHPSVPARSVKELVALARARPGQIAMASPGSGSLPHLALELLKTAARIDMLHVPYKGAAPAVTDVVAGQAQGMFADVPVLYAHVKARKLRALAVTAPQRAKVLPEVPTTAEQGYPSVNVINWYGILVAANTPREVVARLNEAVVKALGNAELRERLTQLGAEPSPSTPDQFSIFIRAEFARWGRIAMDSGAKAE